MLRVALTGGAASGKSAAASMLRDLGAFVSQSDEIGRAMMQPGRPVYREIVQHFGVGITLQDASLDRRALARIAFAEGRADELNRIVHPVVIAAQTAWMQQIEAAHPFAVAVVESALVLETKYGPAGEDRAQPWRTRFDRIVLVCAPEEARLERYIRRVLASEPLAERTSAEADARRRFAAQMPEAQKRLLADIAVENDGTLDELRRTIASLYDRLRQEAVDRTAPAM